MACFFSRNWKWQRALLDKTVKELNKPAHPPESGQCANNIPSAVCDSQSYIVQSLEIFKKRVTVNLHRKLDMKIRIII